LEDQVIISSEIPLLVVSKLLKNIQNETAAIKVNYTHTHTHVYLEHIHFN